MTPLEHQSTTPTTLISPARQSFYKSDSDFTRLTEERSYNIKKVNLAAAAAAVGACLGNRVTAS